MKIPRPESFDLLLRNRRRTRLDSTIWGENLKIQKQDRNVCKSNSQKKGIIICWCDFSYLIYFFVELAFFEIFRLIRLILRFHEFIIRLLFVFDPRQIEQFPIFLQSHRLDAFRIIHFESKLWTHVSSILMLMVIILKLCDSFDIFLDYSRYNLIVFFLSHRNIIAL